MFTVKNKLFISAILLFFLIWYLVPYVHELAHAAVCEASGYKSHIVIIFTGEARVTICTGPPANIDLYRAAGGLAGSAASAALAFAPRRKLFFIAAFPFLPQQALIAGMETLAYKWYVAENNIIPSAAASILTLSLFLVLLCKQTLDLRSKVRELLRCPWEPAVDALTTRQLRPNA